MNYNQLIHDFLEGNISKKDEANLFMSLSSNDELRNELKQSIKIDKAFESRLSAMSPSAKSTMGIFNTLGIAAPGAAVASPKPGIFSRIYSKIGQGLIGAGIASLLFVSSYITFIKDSDSASDSQKTIPVVISYEAIDPGNSLPASTQGNVTNENQEKVRTIIKYIYIDKPASDKLNSNSETENTIPGISISDSKYNANSNPEIFAVANRRNVIPDVMSSMQYTPLSANLYVPAFKGLSLEIRASQNWTSPEADNLHTTTPKLSNMGASLWYEFNKQIQLGLDIRQEKFYQEFEGLDDFNDLYLYRQYSNYIGISAAMRYKILYNQDYNIFGQVNLGGVQTGFLGRISAGVEITPSDYYSMVLSIEGSSLLYEHQNSWWLAPKYGLNYGFNVKF